MANFTRKLKRANRVREAVPRVYRTAGLGWSRTFVLNRAQRRGK